MPAKENKVYEADVEENKTMASLSYLWGLCLIPLLFKRKSKFAQFHAKQGFVLFLIDLIIALLMWIPVFGQLLLLLAVVISALGFIKAYNGEWWRGPFIYRLSEKIKI